MFSCGIFWDLVDFGVYMLDVYYLQMLIQEQYVITTRNTDIAGANTWTGPVFARNWSRTERSRSRMKSKRSSSVKAGKVEEIRYDTMIAFFPPDITDIIVYFIAKYIQGFP